MTLAIIAVLLDFDLGKLATQVWVFPALLATDVILRVVAGHCFTACAASTVSEGGLSTGASIGVSAIVSVVSPELGGAAVEAGLRSPSGVHPASINTDIKAGNNDNLNFDNIFISLFLLVEFFWLWVELLVKLFRVAANPLW